jgi:hypothetical protein
MKKIRKWQVVYFVCGLAYMGWMIHAGTNEFNRINSQYSLLVKQLDSVRIRDSALEELRIECRKGRTSANERQEDGCLSWPSPVVEAKAKEIRELRTRTRGRGFIKLVLFYAGFVLFFLLGPPVLVYLLLAGVLVLYKNIKIVR